VLIPALSGLLELIKENQVNCSSNMSGGILPGGRGRDK
jgi:hypothetical protein